MFIFLCFLRVLRAGCHNRAAVHVESYGWCKFNLKRRKRLKAVLSPDSVRGHTVVQASSFVAEGCFLSVEGCFRLGLAGLGCDFFGLDLNFYFTIQTW